MNLFRYSGILTRRISYSSLDSLTCSRSPVRLSAHKLFVHILATSTDGSFDPVASQLAEQVGMDRGTVSAALELLTRLKLIREGRILTLKDEPYFQVPRLFLQSDVLREQSPACVLVYLSILARGNQVDHRLVKASIATLSKTLRLNKRTVSGALRSLSTGPRQFLRKDNAEVEILNPLTGQRLQLQKTPTPVIPIPVEEETIELEPAPTGKSITLSELLTPPYFKTYYAMTFPDIDLDKHQHNLHCPFHDDSNPSFRLNLTRGVWTCHAGCGCGGMREFEKRLLKTRDNAQAWRSITRKLGVELATGIRNTRLPVSKHPYHDEHGDVLYKLERYANRGGCFFTWSPITEKWRKGLTVPRRLYNLHELLRARTVVLCEGETKCDAVAVLHLLDDHGEPVATTTSGGANSWKEHFLEPLRGKRVLVFPDADDKGLQYLATVTASLTVAGIEHHVVDFAPFGNDVRDLLADGGAQLLTDYVSAQGCNWLADADPVESMTDCKDEAGIPNENEIVSTPIP